MHDPDDQGGEGAGADHPARAGAEGSASPSATEETASHRATVLDLVADPGLPAELARWLTRELPDHLGRDGDGGWEVRLSDQPISLDQRGALPMLEIGDKVRADTGADAVVLITDLPRRVGRDAVVADAGTGHRVGLVSVPALGGFNQARRLRDTVTRLVTAHLIPAEDRSPIGERAHATRAGALVRLDPEQDTGDGENTDPDDTDDAGSAGVENEVDVRLGLTGMRGWWRLLGGVVRANRPWRLVYSLSPAIAAAAAGAAFGIFYSNIWQLATALGTGRQAVLLLLALVGMCAWLIFDNGLWEHRRDGSLRAEAWLSNVSTVCTIAVGVATMYAVLFAMALLAAVVVIPPEYLGSQLMRDTRVTDYLLIAWLSTSIGTVAGALGSGFADEGAVRQAAYSRREQERRASLDREEQRSG